MTDSKEAPETAPLQVSADDRGHRVFKRAFLLFFVLLLFGMTFWAGYDRGVKNAPGVSTAVLSPDDAIIVNKKTQDDTIDFSLFWKVWEILKDKYVDKTKLDAHALFYGAIQGMLAATGDPYTTFFTPKENKAFTEVISGTFDGIGAEMGYKDDIITIIAPLEGAPAEKAGLLAGDKIVKIDDVDASTYSLDEAVSHIRGPKGTKVKLTIFRSGEEAPRDVTVMRDAIQVKSVRFEMKENDIAYIKVNSFGEDTEQEFNTAVKQVLNKKARALVIDLRNNPGGLLKTAVAMGSMMLPGGQVVVIEEDGQGKRTELKARGGDVLSQLPTIVLLNEGSASASEILAGALRDDRDNVTLVGVKSFGKGSVQERIPLTNDTSMKITVARWLTPSGKQIHHVGISPDIEVKLTRDDRENKRDPQLDRALEEVNKSLAR